MNKIIDKSVILVGTVRDEAKKFPKNFKVLEAALSVFAKVDYFIVESDSMDATVEILDFYSAQKSNFGYISLGNLEKTISDRVKRIAYCRNVYVNKIRSSGEYDYIIVADLDGINNRISKKAIQSCFQQEDFWDVATANQPFGYYDLFALRADSWNDSNCFRIWNEKKETLSLSQRKKGKQASTIMDFILFDKFREEILYSKMKRISPCEDWIPVRSAFGGLAIYKSEIFHKFDYSTTEEIERIENCEHVYLNTKIVEEGYRIAINPKLINSWINEYNLNKFKAVRFYRYYLRARFIERSKRQALK